MAYRILTYTDPYSLRKENFWEEIRSIPHLCASQGILRGMNSLYSQELTSLMCTVDHAVNEYFHPWCSSYELYIKQYTQLSEVINSLVKEENNIFKQAVRFNQAEILSSIRLLIELSITSHDFNLSDSSRVEQRLLVKALRKIEDSNMPDFHLPDHGQAQWFLETISSIIDGQIKSIHKYSHDENSDANIARLTSIRQSFEQQNVQKIVVHGLHQFRPLMSKMFDDLSNNGMDIIFLFNYQKQYQQIYQTWFNVYSQFEIPVPTDSDAQPMESGLNPDSLNLGRSFARFIDGVPISEKLESIPYYSFGNTNDFTNYILPFYEEGRRKNDRDPLEEMSEQFFVTEPQVNDILKLYYPDQYGERHFLAYPIGRFFMEMYRLWDVNLQEMKFDYDAIKEIMAAGIISGKESETVLSDYSHYSLFMKGVSTLAQATTRLEDLSKNLLAIRKNMALDEEALLKKFTFYIPENENVRPIIDFLNDLNRLAIHFFGSDDKQKIDFGRHYDKIQSFLRHRSQSELISYEDQQLISALLRKLDNVAELDVKGSFLDLRDSISYYLRQISEDAGVRPIVAGFEQIEGEIWRSRNSPADRTYHFAALSDNQIHKTFDDVVPWPLSADFFERAILPLERSYRLYMTSMDEYSSFIRYQLFHGWYFNRRRIKLSYIVSTEREDKNQPYHFLEYVGIKPRSPEQNYGEELRKEPTFTASSRECDFNSVSTLEAQTFKLCPYRYFHEFILESNAYKGFSNEYLIKLYYYQVYLLERVWKIFADKNIDFLDQHIDSELEKEFERNGQLFPFMRTAIDYHDIKRRFKEYFYKNCVDPKLKKVRHRSKAFMNIKKNFVYAKYSNKGINYFDSIWKLELGQENPELIARKLNEAFIRNSDPHFNPGEWCAQCRFDENCMERFRSEDLNDI